MQSKATVEVTDSFVIIHFARNATIPGKLWYRLRSEGFDKLGAKGSNDYVAIPEKSERELCQKIAELIAADYNAGKYPDIIYPKPRLRHG